jgi:hypothetical protein
MGHNQKTARRLEWIQENRNRTVTNQKMIRDLAGEYRKNEDKRDRELLVLEKRLLGEIEKIAELAVELREDFELHRRPWYRKALDSTKNVIQKAPSSSPAPEAEDEVIELDFDDEETDPAGVVPISEDIVTQIVPTADDQEEDKRTIMDKLHDPQEILKRLESRRDAEKGIIEDLMADQELDQEEKAEAIDAAITRMEGFELRIAHQKLILAGFKEAPE